MSHLEQLRLVGGETTLEGQRLTAAAALAGLSVRWLDFDSPEAQAAIAAQGSGAVRLPLVIIGATYTLQRPSFAEVVSCLAALRSDDGVLPAGAVMLGNHRCAIGRRLAHDTRTTLLTCARLSPLVAAGSA